MADLFTTLLARIDLTLVMILVTCLAGSFGKDYLRIMRSAQPERLSIINIVLSAITATVVTYSFSDFIVAKLGDKSLATVSFVTGLLGFQLMEKLSSIDGVLELATKLSGLAKPTSPAIPQNINVNVTVPEHEAHNPPERNTKTRKGKD